MASVVFRAPRCRRPRSGPTQWHQRFVFIVPDQIDAFLRAGNISGLSFRGDPKPHSVPGADILDRTGSLLSAREIAGLDLGVNYGFLCLYFVVAC